MPIDGPGVWTLVPAIGTVPTQLRQNPSLTFDPVRNRFLLCGGNGYTASYSVITRGDAWELTLGATAIWRRLPDMPPRHMHAAVYDSIADRLLVHGGTFNYSDPLQGWSNVPYGNVLSFAGANGPWADVSPAGAGPGTRSGQASVYDPTGPRVWIYGGASKLFSDGTWIGPFLDDLWSIELSGTPSWLAHPKTSDWPVQPGHGLLSLDVPASRLSLLIYGSANTQQQRWRRANDASSGWSPVLSNGPWPYGGLGWQFHDVAGGQFVLVDRNNYAVSKFPDIPDANIVTGAPPAAPSPPARPRARNRAAMANDPATGSSYLFGGDARITELCSSPHGASFRDDEYNDLWRIPSDPALSAVRLNPANPPSWRSGHVMIVDRRSRLIIFGGRHSTWSSCATTGSEIFFGDVKGLDLTSPTSWVDLAPSGTPPGVWAPDVAVYDQFRDRMLVLGSRADEDVWALELASTPTWIKQTCLNEPAGTLRYRGAILDPVGDRVLVHGLMGDQALWALSLATNTWSPVATSGNPPPVATVSTRAVYDPIGRRMLVYNGTSATNPVHELVLSSSLQWRRLDATTGVAPSIRENPAVTFEPATDRLIVFGGYDPGARKELGDTQVLARDLPTPTQASVASASATHNTAEIFWDVTEIPADIRVESSEGVDRNWLDMGSPSLLARDRLYFKFSGLRPGASRGFRLTWMESGAVRTAGEVWVTPSGAQQLALAMPGVTQSGAIPRGVLTLGESGEAHLEILDISGRRLGQPRRFAPTADAIPVSFDELHASDAGVFWVRVRQGNATVTKRFVRLP